MKDKSFAKAMNQIAAQAAVEQEKEAKAQRRSEIFASVRKVCLFLLGAALLGTGFYYRDELQGYFNEKLRKSSTVADGETSKAVQGIQANANKRDNILDEITK